VLLDQFAPKTGQAKYFRLNFEEIVGGIGPENREYKDLSKMDDGSLDNIAKREARTKAWIKKNDALIIQAAEFLKRFLLARPIPSATK
jgi:hypothetical protein